MSTIKRFLVASLGVIQMAISGGTATYAANLGTGSIGTISSVISANQVSLSYIRPETYGAKRDGITDDQAAIQKAISVAKQQGMRVYFTSGIYACGSQLTDNGVPLYAEIGSTINFQNSNNGGLVLTGFQPSVYGLTITFTRPVSNPNVAGLLISNAQYFTVSFVFIHACPGDNVDCLSSGPGTISTCTFDQSQASSLLIRDSLAVTVDTNSMDNFAVLSGKGLSRQLVITNNGIGSRNGYNSGLVPKLAGLSECNFTGNKIVRGALYVGASKLPPFNSGYLDGNVSGLYIANNTIDGQTVLPDPNITLGVVVNPLLSSTSTRVQIRSNRIQFLQGSASGVYVGANSNAVNVNNNTLDSINGPSSRAASTGILTNSVSDVVIENNTLTNISSSAIQCNPTKGTGSLSILNNSIGNACSTTAAFVDLPVIAVKGKWASANLSSLTITANVYDGPANRATTFVECLVPSTVTNRTIRSNIQTRTTLPNFIVP